MTFSETLKAERTRLKLTQQECADLLEVSKRAIWKWENEEQEPLKITAEGAIARLKKAKTKKG